MKNSLSPETAMILHGFLICKENSRKCLRRRDNIGTAGNEIQK